jgi:hypothetical protein
LSHLYDDLFWFAMLQFGLKSETGSFRFLAGFFKGGISGRQFGLVNRALMPGQGSRWAVQHAGPVQVFFQGTPRACIDYVQQIKIVLGTGYSQYTADHLWPVPQSDRT